MKSRPILFSAPMVRALLDGTKTQTRRVVKQQPDWFEPGADWQYGNGHSGLGWYVNNSDYPEEGASFYHCPYGQVGDQLWVRETWYCDDFRVLRGPYLKPDDLDVVDARETGTLSYAADGRNPYEADQPTWKPSIHMPRWASRITLEITGVRVERLQDTTRGDCMAEGCPFPNIAKETNPKGWYRDLWASINDADSWEKNPWVWVIEFKRMAV